MISRHEKARAEGETDGERLGTPPHEHALRLVAVHLEDAVTTRELRCETCGSAWFS